MKLIEIAERAKLKDLTPELRDQKSAEITRGYVSDLLSDVLANAPSGGVLVTVQAHINVIAVAVHAGVAAVVFANNRVPEESVRQKAVDEKVQLYVSKEPAFEIVGKLYECGVRGGRA